MMRRDYRIGNHCYNWFEYHIVRPVIATAFFIWVLTVIVMAVIKCVT